MRHDEQRDRILRVAARVFEEKGYAAATLDDVARGVGILKGSLYYYFKSKSEILFEVIMHAVRELEQALTQIEQSPLSPTEKIRLSIQRHLEPYHDRHAEISVFLNDTAFLSRSQLKDVEAVVERYEQLWGDLIEAGVKTGEIRSDLDQRVMVFAILGACNWVHRWYRPSGRLSIQQIAEVVAAMVIEGIRTPEARPRARKRDT